MSSLTYFCQHCWAELPAGTHVCPRCGSELDERLPYRQSLELALRCVEATTARRAAYLLGELRDPAAIPSLVSIIADGDPYTAGEAVAALAKIGTDEALERVREVTGHQYVTVRAAARSALQDWSRVTPQTPT